MADIADIVYDYLESPNPQETFKQFKKNIKKVLGSSELRTIIKNPFPTKGAKPKNIQLGSLFDNIKRWLDTPHLLTKKRNQISGLRFPTGTVPSSSKPEKEPVKPRIPPEEEPVPHHPSLDPPPEINSFKDVIRFLQQKATGDTYTGAYTPLSRYVDEGFVPKTAMDLISLEHDLYYTLATSEEDVNVADRKFIKRLKELPTENWVESLRGASRSAIMKVKNYVDETTYSPTEQIFVDFEKNRQLAPSLKKTYENMITILSNAPTTKFKDPIFRATVISNPEAVDEPTPEEFEGVEMTEEEFEAVISQLDRLEEVGVLEAVNDEDIARILHENRVESVSKEDKHQFGTETTVDEDAIEEQAVKQGHDRRAVQAELARIDGDKNDELTTAELGQSSFLQKTPWAVKHFAEQKRESRLKAVQEYEEEQARDRQSDADFRASLYPHGAEGDQYAPPFSNRYGRPLYHDEWVELQHLRYYGTEEHKRREQQVWNQIYRTPVQFGESTYDNKDKDIRNICERLARLEHNLRYTNTTKPDDIKDFYPPTVNFERPLKRRRDPHPYKGEREILRRRAEVRIPRDVGDVNALPYRQNEVPVALPQDRAKKAIVEPLRDDITSQVRDDEDDKMKPEKVGNSDAEMVNMIYRLYRR
jgi:hypothetical protein